MSTEHRTDHVSPEEALVIMALFNSLDRESLKKLAYGFACALGSISLDETLDQGPPSDAAQQVALRMLDGAMQMLDAEQSSSPEDALVA